jgi:hypothetical protein
MSVSSSQAGPRPRTTTKPNSARITRQITRPNSSPATGEDEVGMRVGQDVLDPALARAAAEQPAIAERLHGDGHL